LEYEGTRVVPGHLASDQGLSNHWYALSWS
jgi:hypothetical protein